MSRNPSRVSCTSCFSRIIQTEQRSRTRPRYARLGHGVVRTTFYRTAIDRHEGIPSESILADYRSPSMETVQGAVLYLLLGGPKIVKGAFCDRLVLATLASWIGCPCQTTSFRMHQQALWTCLNAPMQYECIRDPLYSGNRAG